MKYTSNHPLLWLCNNSFKQSFITLFLFSFRYCSGAMGNNYFLIFSLETRKVLDVSGTNKDEVILWESHGGDNQLWFWDGEDILRNKMCPDKVSFFFQNFLNFFSILSYLPDQTKWPKKAEQFCKNSIHEIFDIKGQ